MKPGYKAVGIPLELAREIDKLAWQIPNCRRSSSSGFRINSHDRRDCLLPAPARSSGISPGSPPSSPAPQKRRAFNGQAYF